MATILTPSFTRLSPHLGVEAHDFDLSRDLDQATKDAILDAWIDSGVVVFLGVGTSGEASEAPTTAAWCAGFLEETTAIRSGFATPKDTPAQSLARA